MARWHEVPDLSGRTTDVASLAAGKVVLVAFWASWCQPCAAEMPALKAAATRYRDRGAIVLGIGLREGGDNIPLQRRAAAKAVLNYQLLFDTSGAYQSAYAIHALPRNLLVGRDGRIRWQGDLLPEDLDARIEALLAEAPPGGAP